MKTFRISVCVSDALGDIKPAVDDLLVQLNRHFVPRGVEFVPTLQGEGPAEGDLALVLYWKDFGELPEEGFRAAYKAFAEKKSPKIYVFFKEPDAEITEALKRFKEAFAKDYGHFFCHFETLDSVRFQVTVQSLGLLPGGEGAGQLQMEDSAIVLGKERIVSLDNLPFAKLNPERQSLQRQIAAAEREAGELESQWRAAPDNETLAETLRAARVRRRQLKDRLKEHEGFLFASALYFAKASAERMDERVRKAYELFERGKVEAANRVLDLKELVKKDERDKKIYDERRKARVAMLEEYRLAAEMALANAAVPEAERNARAREAFGNALRIGKEIGCEEAELAGIREKLDSIPM
jgi:hypothetical protein